MTTKISNEEIIKLVENDHWIHGKSLRLIERENNLSNDTIRKRCISLGIKTKSRKQSIIENEKHIDRPVGDKHWSKTNPELLAKCANESSLRMKEDNPINKDGVAELIAETKSKLYAVNPTFHESLFIDILESLNVNYEFQIPISKYIPDFKIGNVLIELDGRGHASRKATDIIRDQFLCGLGFYVVRINQDSLFDKRSKKPMLRPNKLIRVIEDLIPSLNVSCLLPSVTCKYRVVVRKPNPFTEVIY
ncbi:MAG TPA: DUF559 domain-containing protein [Methylococcaceae bacterium]|nr:DUF559 domain-containing protein [Methylococcaceae bacterium]